MGGICRSETKVKKGSGYRVVIAALAAVAMAGVAAPGVAAEQRYAIAEIRKLPRTDLPDTDCMSAWLSIQNPPPIPQDINDHGQVVGYLDNGLTQPRSDEAFLYDGEATLGLGRLGGYSSSARGINNVGQVVGGLMNEGWGYEPFLYEDGVMTSLNLFLPPEFDGYLWDAAAINDAGQIVGRGYIDGEFRVYLMTPGAKCPYTFTTFRGLAEREARAQDVNRFGEVAGSLGIAQGVLHAFYWADGEMTDLGTLGGENSKAWAINDAGQVVGFAETEHGDKHAFLWQQGEMTDLGTLPGGTESEARDINNAGQIVGYSEDPQWTHPHRCCSAVLWQDGEIINLHTVLPAWHTWELGIATGINESGQIVGNGDACHEERAFLLTPIPDEAEDADLGDVNPACPDIGLLCGPPPETPGGRLCGTGIATLLPFVLLGLSFAKAWGRGCDTSETSEGRSIARFKGTGKGCGTPVCGTASLNPKGGL